MKLSKDAKRAVRASIKHWRKDVLAPVKAGNYGGLAHFGSDCPCCEAFFSISCRSACPLGATPDKSCCGGTWIDFDMAMTTENAEAVIAYMEKILEGDA